MPDIPIQVNIPTRAARDWVDRAIKNGDIKLELKCGGELLPHAVHATQFTIDKRKLRVRFSDETEDSVKVWIEKV